MSTPSFAPPAAAVAGSIFNFYAASSGGRDFGLVFLGGMIVAVGMGVTFYIWRFKIQARGYVVPLSFKPEMV